MNAHVQFNTNAQLFENASGDLAIRFANNVVYEAVGQDSEEGFVEEAATLLKRGLHPEAWRKIPFNKLLHDGQQWHLVSSMGFLDGDEGRPAVALEVAPGELGDRARNYLKPAMPETLK